MSLSKTTTNATTTAAPAKPARKPRAYYGKHVTDRDPVVTPVTIDGVDCLSVEAFGRHAWAPFVIEAVRWEHVVETWGSRWTMLSSGGKFYVGSSRRMASRDATHGRAACPIAILSRLLSGAERGEEVHFRNGNVLDLRRDNLEVITIAEARARRRQRLA